MVLLTVSIFFAQLCQHCCGICHLAVDFTAAGIHINALAYQLAELFTAAAHQLSYQQPGNHAAVAAGEIAEIMMRAHFSTIQHVIITHAFLHKGMSALTAHWHTAVTLQNSFGVPGKARVEHNLCTRLLVQENLRQQTYDVIALDKICLLIKEEATVEVTIPGNTQIRTALAYNLGRSLTVGQQQRVRHTVGEGAVRRFVQCDKFKRQMLRQLLQNRTGTTIAGVSNNLHRLKHACINIGQQMLNIGRHNIHLLHSTHSLACYHLMHELLGCSNHLADFLQTGITGNRTCIAAHQLHAVIFLRIMAGSNHDTAVCFQMSGSKINHFRTALADINNLGAAMAQSLRQCIHQCSAAQADIMSDNNSFRSEHCRKNSSHTVSHFLVNFCGVNAAYIVGLKSLVRNLHLSILLFYSVFSKISLFKNHFILFFMH